MIKLIASDVDGTLIQESTHNLYQEMTETIRELKKKGIFFCAASGRQYDSIKNVFHEVGDDIIYIANNGAQIRYGGEDISLTGMRRADVENIILELREYDNTCDIVVCTTEGSLSESKNKDFIDLMTKGYRNQFRVVEDILAEETEVMKISIHRNISIRDLGETVLIPRWQDRVRVCVAGEEWIDFMDRSVDKGNALIFLQNHLGISRYETMAFGDNNNDIGMLHAAGASYAVVSARDEVKDAAAFLCPAYGDKGVYQVIKKEVL